MPSCQEASVLGALPGISGSLQAAETLKLLLGVGNTLAGRFLVFDTLETWFTGLEMERDPNRPVCGENLTITADSWGIRSGVCTACRTWLQGRARCPARCASEKPGSTDERIAQEVARLLALEQRPVPVQIEKGPRPGELAAARRYAGCQRNPNPT